MTGWQSLGNTLATRWNRRPDLHQLMTGAGPVALILNAEVTEFFVLDWSLDGAVTYIANTVAPLSFSATEDEWRQFMRGEYAAVIGVMSGKIAFRGPMAFAVKYGRRFDAVRDLGRDISW